MAQSQQNPRLRRHMHPNSREQWWNGAGTWPNVPPLRQQLPNAPPFPSRTGTTKNLVERQPLHVARPRSQIAPTVAGKRNSRYRSKQNKASKQPTMLAAIHAKRAQARQAGPKRLYQSYAQPVPLASWNLRPVFRADTIEPVRQALLSTSGECQGRLFIADDHVHQLSFPASLYKPDGTAVLIGSITDTLDHPSVVELPLASTNQWFVSLAKAPNAANAAVNILAVANGPAPDQVSPPAPADGEREAPSSARLHFPGTDLRFGAFPVMLPVPCGIDIPPEHPINVPFPDDVIAAAPFLEEWRLAAAWTVSRNGGLSANHGGPMFDQEALDFDPPTFLQHFDTTVNNIQLDYNLVRPAIGLYTEAMVHINPATNAAWDRIAATIPTPIGTATAEPTPALVPGALASPGPVTPNDSTRFIEAVLERAFTTRTPDEREAADQTSKVKGIFSLLTAYIDEGTHLTMVPGTLTDHFSRVLEKKKNDAAMEELVDGINETMSTIRRDGHYLSYAMQMKGKMFDIPLTTAIKKGALYTTSFLHDSKPAQKLSVLSFASPTKEINNRAQADSAAMNHAAVGNDTSQIATNHEVFVGGKLNSLLDAQRLIANTLTFLVYICAEPAKSELYKSLHKLLGILNDQNTSEILQGRKGQPQIAHTIAAFTQDIFAGYATVAKTSALLQAIKENRLLDAAPIKQAVQYADIIINQIKTNISTAPVTFETEGILWEILHPVKEGKAASRGGNHAAAPTFPRSSYETPPATGKRTADGQRKPQANSDETELTRLAGFLTTDRKHPKEITDLAGKCPAFMITPSGAEERLCLRYCLKGWKCGWRKCHFAHPTSFSAIDRTNQSALADWVSKTPGIEFLPGEGPSGTP